MGWSWRVVGGVDGESLLVVVYWIAISVNHQAVPSGIAVPAVLHGEVPCKRRRPQPLRYYLAHLANRSLISAPAIQLPKSGDNPSSDVY